MSSPAGATLPLLGMAAFSGTGKTTLLTKLIPVLARHGIRTAVIKHAHHDFDIDYPGKDSYELRKSGADQVIVASDQRWAMVTELRREPELATLLAKLDAGRVDLVLVEGFKHVRFPKVELHRSCLGKPLLYPDDEGIIAIACDPATVLCGDKVPPRVDIDDVDAVAVLVADWLKYQEPPGDEV